MLFARVIPQKVENQENVTNLKENPTKCLSPLIIDLKPAPKIALTSMNTAIMNNFRKK